VTRDPGPRSVGYIGYSLLANGYCKTLTLSDINPIGVEAARLTAQYNRIEHLVNIYESDVLSKIPADEKWDVVIGTPPANYRDMPDSTVTHFCDPDWSVHRRFYQSVGEFMNPGGHILMLEPRYGATPDIFEPMIREGGGTVVATEIGVALTGIETEVYYMLSRW
jgi:methylase of polypeptide subunit release factors